MKAFRRFVGGAAAFMYLGISFGCGEDPVVLQIDGNWHIDEAFADEIHLVACSGVGQVNFSQTVSADGVTGTSVPSSSFSAVAGVQTDCTSIDGPFDYFGNGTFTTGVVEPGRINQLRWSGTVNEAVCDYRGVLTGDGVYGFRMSGTLSCVLEDPGVTFNFEGSWEAHSAKSPWCEERRLLSGCVL